STKYFPKSRFMIAVAYYEADQISSHHRVYGAVDSLPYNETKFRNVTRAGWQHGDAFQSVRRVSRRAAQALPDGSDDGRRPSLRRSTAKQPHRSFPRLGGCLLPE